MRHTGVRLAASSGVNLNRVVRMLGHKNPVMVLENYKGSPGA
jgi:hypothetical protein